MKSNLVEGYTNSQLRKMRGVYCFTFPNGKRYVGIVVGKRNFGHRFSCHRSESYKNPKYPIHFAIRNFGWENIKKEIILVTDDEKRSKMLETQLIAFWKLNIKRFGDKSNGYNMTDGGEGNTGPTGKPAWNKGKKGSIKHTEESKRLISNSAREFMNEPEVKEKYRKILSEREWSKESRDKISKKMKGNTWNKGRIFSKEHSENIRKSKIGHQVSNECRDKIRNSEYHKNLGGMNNPSAKKRKFKNKVTGEIIEGPMKCVGDSLGFNGKSFAAIMLKKKEYKDWVWIDE